MATTKPRERKVNTQKNYPVIGVDSETDTFLKEYKENLENEYDEIHEPQHYKNLPNGVQCWDVIQFMPANISHAIKYLWRQGEKPGQDAVKELKKSIQWIQHEINRLEGNYPKMGK